MPKKVYRARLPRKKVQPLHMVSEHPSARRKSGKDNVTIAQSIGPTLDNTGIKKEKKERQQQQQQQQQHH